MTHNGVHAPARPFLAGARRTIPFVAHASLAHALLAHALLACALVACARRVTPEREAARDADRAAGRSADSARAAAAERGRSAATQVVTFTEEERRRYTRVEHMIRARFTGVTVTPSGRGFSVQIRGSGSFGSSTEPLVVVDGASRTTADLGGLDPREVERIEIIKDGAAAIYGSRGANGVIVIATRRAR
jgi:TonB-dependent SusC/RagA subfamily outer membrane receptor